MLGAAFADTVCSWARAQGWLGSGCSWSCAEESNWRVDPAMLVRQQAGLELWIAASS
jgi:hypothetical protein